MPTITKEAEIEYRGVLVTGRGAYTYDGADSSFELEEVLLHGIDVSELLITIEDTWDTIQEKCREQLDISVKSEREPFAGYKQGD